MSSCCMNNIIDVQDCCPVIVDGGGTGDYNDLTNKPKINNIELIGNKTTEDLGIASEVQFTEFKEEVDTKIENKQDAFQLGVDLEWLSNVLSVITSPGNDTSKIAKTDDEGKLHINEPLANDHPTTKQFVEEQDNLIKAITTAIQSLIPPDATIENQLADKSSDNSSINRMLAHLLTKDAQGNPLNTKADLDSATQFYYAGQIHDVHSNDYVIVLEDENHDNKTTIYVYQENDTNGIWAFNSSISGVPLTAQQLDALNSCVSANWKQATDTELARTVELDFLMETGETRRYTLKGIQNA